MGDRGPGGFDRAYVDSVPMAVPMSLDIWGILLPVFAGREDAAGTRRWVEVKLNVCANGKTGYSAEGKGDSYSPKNPCKNERRHGHIFCESCRKEAGGY